MLPCTLKLTVYKSAQLDILFSVFAAHYYGFNMSKHRSRVLVSVKSFDMESDLGRDFFEEKGTFASNSVRRMSFSLIQDLDVENMVRLLSFSFCMYICNIDVQLS